MTTPIPAEKWYETIRFSDDITLIHEPWITPFFRCNIWHVRGRDRDLLFDSGLGHFSLRDHVPLVTERPLIAVASHTHFDHIGCHYEFAERAVHVDEAEILADPQNELTLADKYATDEMFIQPPVGWESAAYRVRAAPTQTTLRHGDVIDLGDRAFEVVHTPGHSPGGIGLFERGAGVFLSGDIIYDGPLIDDAYHSDRLVYADTLKRIADLPVSVVHGGHFPSFGAVRFHQLIDDYRQGLRAAGCHLT